MKEKLKQLLAVVSEAVKLAAEDVTAGEYHIQPIYTALKNAEAGVARRIYQIEDSERDLAAQKAAEEKAKADAEAVARAKADRAKFEADAIAKAEAEAAAEKERKEAYEAKRSGESRARYGKKELEELTAIAGKRSISYEPGIKKGKLINLLLQADGLVVTQADQETADKE